MMRSLALVTICSLLAGAAGAAEPAIADPIVWRAYDAAISEASQTGKPVLIHFTADWCGWCTKMKRETYTQPDVARLMNEAFVPILVDADRNPQLKARYGVQGLPTIWFVTSDGKGITYIPGFVDAATFRSVLQWIASGAYASQSFEQYRAAEG
ncbi:MAG TPA: DUF255 domain-containing protein [Candidatus Krumholzibacteria bacterium]|nr:DUF255 domain-containing protein [Candidatus Krumholzibacteria bacterium]HPD72419.1 DUF255 domain-containing protein [Candidatus Krumholzibacteria bacterium]HRY40649.1 DUF255 domain-containing protein [Candidatus Krumholzibacteria bacterium]